jgi:hypothetical protein
MAQRTILSFVVGLLAVACAQSDSAEPSSTEGAGGQSTASAGAGGTAKGGSAAGASAGKAGSGGQKAQAGAAGAGAASGNAGSATAGGGGKGGAGGGATAGAGGSSGSPGAAGKGGSGSAGKAGAGGGSGGPGTGGMGAGGAGGGPQVCVDWVYMGNDPNACSGHLGSSCGWTPTNEGQGFHCQVASWGVDCEPGGGGCSGGTGGSGGGGTGGSGNTGGSTGSTDPFHGYRVVGYLPDYDGDPNTVQYDKLTHINFAFATVNGDGSLNTATGMLQQLVTKAHAANVKVLISVGGGDADIASVMKNGTTRAAVIKNVEALVSTYKLDGVDIDWEGFDSSSTGAYTALMASLHGDLSPSGKLVTTALDTGSWFGGNVSTDAFQYIDQLNIMAYDGDGPHSPYELAAGGIKYWVGRGYPKAKINIGVPFYGRLNSNWNTEITFKDLVAKDASAAYLDDFAGYNYNGIPTIKKKTQLAMQEVGGIMIWELAQDATGANSLLGAIYGEISK